MIRTAAQLALGSKLTFHYTECIRYCQLKNAAPKRPSFPTPAKDRTAKDASSPSGRSQRIIDAGQPEGDPTRECSNLAPPRHRDHICRTRTYERTQHNCKESPVSLLDLCSDRGHVCKKSGEAGSSSTVQLLHRICNCTHRPRHWYWWCTSPHILSAHMCLLEKRGHILVRRGANHYHGILD